MRWLAAIVLVPSLALAGETDIPQTCTGGFVFQQCHDTLRECSDYNSALAAENDRLKIAVMVMEAQLGTFQAASIKRRPIAATQKAQDGPKAIEPPQKRQRYSGLPCKKGRTRNAKGLCGRW